MGDNLVGARGIPMDQRALLRSVGLETSTIVGRLAHVTRKPAIGIVES